MGRGGREFSVSVGARQWKEKQICYVSFNRPDTKQSGVSSVLSGVLNVAKLHNVTFHCYPLYVAAKTLDKLLVVFFDLSLFFFF